MRHARNALGAKRSENREGHAERIHRNPNTPQKKGQEATRTTKRHRRKSEKSWTTIGTKCANLVDFKKCRRMNICLLSSASIQPRTSPPKSGLPACASPGVKKKNYEHGVARERCQGRRPHLPQSKSPAKQTSRAMNKHLRQLRKASETPSPLRTFGLWFAQRIAKFLARRAAKHIKGVWLSYRGTSRPSCSTTGTYRRFREIRMSQAAMHSAHFATSRCTKHTIRGSRGFVFECPA